jgi:hypothetical protein
MWDVGEDPFDSLGGLGLLEVVACPLMNQSCRLYHLDWGLVDR